MSLIDSVLHLINKTPKDPDAPKPPAGSRSEREARIKDRAGMVINVFALLLAVNAWYGGKLSSTVLTDTIKANDAYGFYQAKSIKQNMAEYALRDAVKHRDWDYARELKAKIDRYEHEPQDGKHDLLIRARALEAERDEARQRSPWIGFASTAYQMAIVVLSASILAVSMSLFWSSFVIAGIGLLLSLQGLYLWF